MRIDLKNNNSIQTKVAAILREIANEKCLAKAEILTQTSSPIHSLHLRDLALQPSDVTAIATCLKQADESNEQFIQSISFSYNPLLGDSGAIALANNLPKSISELGLVNCGINDLGGLEILRWIKNSPQLRMICMEQNNFSDQLKLEFKKFSSKEDQTLVIY